jgi:hypothetical protein
VTRVDGVTVYCYNQAFFVGTLSIRSANNGQVSFDIVASAFSDLKKRKLNQIDTEGPRSIGTTDTARKAHFKNTLEHPEDYDYAAFPVFNQKFKDLGYTNTYDVFQNFWNVATSDFNMNSAGITPFIRLDYVLKRMFADSDYAFINDWQTSSELRRLYLYNNYDIRIPSGGSIVIPSWIDLPNHLDDSLCTDFLKDVMFLFNLGLFVNSFSHQIKLTPLEKVFTRPPVHDWTAYAIDRPSISYEEKTVVSKFSWPAPDVDKPYSGPLIADDIPLTTFPSFYEFLSQYTSPGLPDGYYYLDCDEVVMAVGGVVPYTRLGIKRKAFVIDDSSVFESKRPPLLTEYADTGSAGTNYCLNGNAKGYYTNADGTRENSPAKNTLMFYRGFQERNIGEPQRWPLSGNDTFNCQADDVALITNGTTVLGSAGYSLLWHKSQGLYQSWWANWHEALYYGKTVTQMLALPISALVQFNFDEKIRVLQMDYFVKRLRVGKAIGNGRVLVEAELVSVI